MSPRSTQDGYVSGSASTKSTANESFGSLSNVTTFDSEGNVLDSQQVNGDFRYDENGKISSGGGGDQSIATRGCPDGDCGGDKAVGANKVNTFVGTVAEGVNRNSTSHSKNYTAKYGTKTTSAREITQYNTKRYGQYGQRSKMGWSWNFICGNRFRDY